MRKPIGRNRVETSWSWRHVTKHLWDLLDFLFARIRTFRCFVERLPGARHQINQEIELGSLFVLMSSSVLDGYGMESAWYIVIWTEKNILVQLINWLIRDVWLWFFINSSPQIYTSRWHSVKQLQFRFKAHVCKSWIGHKTIHGFSWRESVRSSREQTVCGMTDLYILDISAEDLAVPTNVLSMELIDSVEDCFWSR